MEQSLYKSKEKRVFVYFVFGNEIISIYQKQKLIGHFKIDPTKLEEAKNSCIEKMNTPSNLKSIIYIYPNGDLEIDIDVEKPKYGFHTDYSK